GWSQGPWSFRTCSGGGGGRSPASKPPGPCPRLRSCWPNGTSASIRASSVSWPPPVPGCPSAPAGRNPSLTARPQPLRPPAVCAGRAACDGLERSSNRAPMLEVLLGSMVAASLLVARRWALLRTSEHLVVIAGGEVAPVLQVAGRSSSPAVSPGRCLGSRPRLAASVAGLIGAFVVGRLAG